MIIAPLCSYSQVNRKIADRYNSIHGHEEWGRDIALRKNNVVIPKIWYEL